MKVSMMLRNSLRLESVAGLSMHAPDYSSLPTQLMRQGKTLHFHTTRVKDRLDRAKPLLPGAFSAIFYRRGRGQSEPRRATELQMVFCLLGLIR